MEVDLPVWTIRPNWAGGILERLEWITDVLASDSGVEQRRSVRISPRRSFEITVNPTDQDRSYLDLLLHRLGSETWLAPLWHDQARLDSFAENGQAALSFDNTFREFEDDGYAILYADTFTWEVVQIGSQDAEGVVLTEPLAGDWPVGTKLYPLREMILTSDTKLSALTSRVGQSQLLFTIAKANDFPEIMPDGPVFLGRPVLAREPNRSTEISLDHIRLTDEQDGQLGLRYRTDDTGRAFQRQAHNWQVTGRAEQHAFRSMLYWLRGRQRAIWLPSFNQDLTLAAPVVAGAASAVIRKIGLGYIGSGGAIPGRNRFWTGTEALTHTGMGAAPGPATERLNVSAPIVANYPSGASWAFLGAARMDTDTIELQHHTDSDGTFECSATFMSFADDRTTPAPIYLPTPTAAQNTEPCGEPAGDPNPCRPQFCLPQTIYSFDFEFRGCKDYYCPTRNWYPPEFYNNPDYPGIINPPLVPGGPSGRSLGSMISQFNGCGLSGNIYELNYYNDPDSEWYHHPLAIKLQGQLLYEYYMTNGTFGCTYHGVIVNGPGALQIQYGAFFCQAFGPAIGNLSRTFVSPPTCLPVTEVLLAGLEIVGNTPYTWTWE